MPKDEIVRRGIICGEIPLYSLGRLIGGFGGPGALMGSANAQTPRYPYPPENYIEQPPGRR